MYKKINIKYIICKFSWDISRIS